jgi:hypothetical protein
MTDNLMTAIPAGTRFHFDALHPCNEVTLQFPTKDDAILFTELLIKLTDAQGGE